MENGESSSTVLRGFTITNGYAVDGAGMYFYDVAPTLRNLIIADNEATDDGGGVFSMYSQYTMDNVLFHENVAGSWGGGIYGYIDTGSMDNVAFVSNSAGSGGGLVLSWGGMDITNAKIIGNTATYSGGGIYADWDSNDIINGVITGNSANRGGGIYAGKAYLILGASLSSTTEINLGDADYGLAGENSGDYAGMSVSNAGDIDGDGRGDILVGAKGNDDVANYSGKTYLILSGL